MLFSEEKFGHFKKKQYFCSPFRVMPLAIALESEC